MPLNLGDEFPNFDCETTEGNFKFHDWQGDKWALLCSHPADFTPVCTTELGELGRRVKEFEAINTKVIAISCDSVEDHKAWSVDVCSNASIDELGYPIIADPSREIAVKLGMLDPDEKTAAGLPATARAVYIISPDHKVKLLILYPATTGRNFNEIIRVVHSLQLTAYNKVATPVNWNQGDDCMVLPSVKAEDVDKVFPKGVTVKPVPSGKGYLRTTPQPNI